MIRVNGEDTDLRYTWQSIRRLYVEHGINLMDQQAFELETTPESITALLWAGVLHAHPTAAFEDIDFDLGNMAAITALMTERLTIAMGGDVLPEDPLPGTTPARQPETSGAPSTD